ncbi:cardio acceleratory peptide 2b isoform X2 [Uranotaenia lowii]|uniref:cardio acceleratory peptide 2b isoform X2 n=1 Tax=Uranotaenia lowii TaxID=190385 RepID=UPI0024791CB7|nr:cardio acceleratory peptide 2b isoform X2 [Uranotaenia lowii]
MSSFVMLTVPQTKVLVYLSLMMVLLSATKMCRAESDMEVSKRGPTVGLFAFPRVGRSDPELGDLWADSAAIPSDLADEYDDYQSLHKPKRQGLVPFPRVGRSGGPARYPPVSLPFANANSAGSAYQYLMAASRAAAASQQQKRSSNPGAANSGMWFGPRLGKRANLPSSEIKVRNGESRLGRWGYFF